MSDQKESKVCPFCFERTFEVAAKCAVAAIAICASALAESKDLSQHLELVGKCFESTGAGYQIPFSANFRKNIRNEEAACSNMELVKKSFSALVLPESQDEFNLMYEKDPFSGKESLNVQCVPPGTPECLPPKNRESLGRKIRSAIYNSKQREINIAIQKKQREEHNQRFGVTGVGIYIKEISDKRSICPESFINSFDRNCSIRDPFQMTVSMSIRNNMTYPVKDIKVRCSQIAKSGTVLRNTLETVYDLWQAGEIREHNVKILKHEQSNNVSCQVISFN